MSSGSVDERVEVTMLPALPHSASLPNLPSTFGALQASVAIGSLPAARGTMIRSGSLNSTLTATDKEKIYERVSYPLAHSSSQRYSSNFMLKAPVSVMDNGTLLVGGRLEAVQVPGPLRPKTPPQLSPEKTAFMSKMEDLQKKLQSGGSSGNLFPRDDSVPVYVDMPAKQKSDLVMAVTADDVNTLYKLFDVQHLTIKISAHDGNTLFHIAAMSNALKALKVCLRQNKEDVAAIINVQNSKGTTALHLAAVGGNTEMVTRLIDAGANINTLDCCGCTALHVAAHEHMTDMYNHLVKLGAVTDVEDDEGNTPAGWLTSNNDQPNGKTGKAWYEHMLFIRKMQANYAPKKKLGGLTILDDDKPEEEEVEQLPELPPRFNDVHLAWKQFLMSTIDTTGAAALFPLAARVRQQGHLLTPSQIQAARREFEMVDKDSSGWIDRLELAHWLEHLLQWDAPNKVLFQASTNALFMAVDHDCSGLIDFSEFLLLYIAIIVDPSRGRFRLAAETPPEAVAAAYGEAAGAATGPGAVGSPGAAADGERERDIKHIGWKENSQNTFTRISNVIVQKPSY